MRGNTWNEGEANNTIQPRRSSLASVSTTRQNTWNNFSKNKKDNTLVEGIKTHN